MMKKLILLSLIALACADTKAWNRDLNFESPDNWDIERAPCPSDTVIIPEEATSVFLQINGTLKEIILPMNGQIIFATNQQLLFSDDETVDPSCDGQEVTFSRSGPADWLNPNNWKTANGPILVESEKIPCEYDDVVFPGEKQFLVGLDQTEYMSKITFDGKPYTSTGVFANFLSSSMGQQQFSLSNSAQILLHGVQCVDTTGCTCGNSDAQTLNKICSYQSCPDLACRNAPKPVGGCCSVCGAILHMKYNSDFDFEGIKQKFMSDYTLNGQQSANRVRRQADGSVLMYMSKTDAQNIQVVLTDTQSGTESGNAAISVAQQMQADISANPSVYGVSEVTMESSQAGTGKNTGGNLSGGATVGIVLVVLLAVVIVSSIAFVIFRRSSTSLTIRFKKDEPLNAMDIELSSNHFVQDMAPHENGDAVLGFDNPMYATPAQKDNLYADPSAVGKLPPDFPEVEDKGPILEGNEYIEGFTNPLAGNSFETVA